MAEVTPPKWASNLIARMSEDYQVPPPRLHWTKRRKKTSSGSISLLKLEIDIGEGSDKQDARLAVLHEMVHHILLERHQPQYNGEHNDQFYDFFWPIIRRYRFPMKVAIAYEKVGNSGAKRHRQTVTRTYRRAGGRLPL